MNDTIKDNQVTATADQNTTVNSALVINAQQNGLGVIRSIAAANKSISIYAGDHKKSCATFYSRHVSDSFVFPQVFDSQFIPEIVEVGKTLYAKHKTKCLLCPVNDEYVLLFSKHWPELQPYFTPMFMTDTDDLASCVDKNKIYILAEKASVPFPRTASSLDEFVEKGLNFPAVIKPLVRRSPEAIKKGVFRIAFCDSAEEAKQPAGFLESVDEGYVIQEFIDGDDDELYTAGVSSIDGEILATYCGRKLRQFPPTTGVAALAETVYVPKVIEYGERILTAGKYTGVAQVEFKKSGDEYYLMEINPRPWMWNSLSTASGVNLVAAYIKGVDQGFEWDGNVVATEQQNGHMWMSVFNDLLFNVIKNRNASLWQWFQDLSRSKCKAYWELADPIPGLIATSQFLVKPFAFVFKKLKRLFSKSNQ